MLTKVPVHNYKSHSKSDGRLLFSLSLSLSSGDIPCLDDGCEGKYGAVIGQRNPTTWKRRLGTYKRASVPANQSAVPYIPFIIKSRNFAT